MRLVRTALYVIYGISVLAILASPVMFLGQAHANEIRALINSGVPESSLEIHALKESLNFYVTLGMSLVSGGIIGGLTSAILIIHIEKKLKRASFL